MPGGLSFKYLLAVILKLKSEVRFGLHHYWGFSLMRSFSRGFSLLECLVAFSLMMVILAGTLELSQSSRKFFFRLKASQENNQELWASLDRIGRDINKAGQGLHECLNLGLLSGLQAEESGLLIFFQQEMLPLSVDLAEGSRIIPITKSDPFSRGQLIALVAEGKGEIAVIEKVEKNQLALYQPLHGNYEAGIARLMAIQKIRYYLDLNNGILRRQVNASPAQPLLEEVKAFHYSLEIPWQAKVGIILVKEPEVMHEIRVTAKNVLLAQEKYYEN